GGAAHPLSQEVGEVLEGPNHPPIKASAERPPSTRAAALKVRAVVIEARPPIRATPIAPPTWREVLLTAEAMPARSGPSASVAPATSPGTAPPIPAPATARNAQPMGESIEEEPTSAVPR